MLEGPFALALVAGMVATVNPCGFALLPAYLTTFVGMEQRSGRASAVGRALAVSAVLTAGFITVFGLLGMVFGSALNRILEQAPWLTIAIGTALVALGVWLLSGRDLSLAIPKLDRGGSDGSLPSMYLYGVSYAIASLSCSIGPFATVTSSGATGNFMSRLLTFALYGIGMGIVIAVLTVAVALARTEVVGHFRRAAPWINRVAGVLTIVAGAYVIYYGWYEYRLRTPGNEDDAVIDAALSIQGWLASLMPGVGNYGWYLLGGGVVIVGALWYSRRAPSVDGVPDALGVGGVVGDAIEGSVGDLGVDLTDRR